MFRAARSLGRPVGVIELSGMGAAHFRQDPVQGLHARGAGFLGRGRSRETDGQSRYQKN